MMAGIRIPGRITKAVADAQMTATVSHLWNEATAPAPTFQPARPLWKAE